MTVVVWTFALVAAAVHLLAFLWEVILLDRPGVYAGVFRIRAEDLPAVRLWAFGVGLYNLFLGLGMIAGVVAWMIDVPAVGATLVIYLSAFMALSGFGLFIADRMALSRPRGAGVGGAIAQGLPPLIALAAALSS